MSAPPFETLPAAPDAGSALRILAGRLESLEETPVFRRVEAPVAAPFDPLPWLGALPADGALPRCLLGAGFGGAGEALALAFGFAADLPGHAARAAALGLAPEQAAGLSFGCSLRFDTDAPVEEDWASFGQGRLWLPLLELDGAAGRAALNLMPAAVASGAAGRLAAALRGLDGPRTPGAPPAVAWRPDPGFRQRWDGDVRAALDAMLLAGGPTKIVLARVLDGEAEADPDPVALLAAGAAGGWPWWIERSGASWLGESPEPLGRRRGRSLRTVALAGTRPRGAGPAEDDARGAELLDSGKDRREQEAVTAWLRPRLALLAEGPVEVGPLELELLPGLQHLKSALAVRLREGLEDAGWLAALHPTPALGGAPREAALDWLRGREGFDRGLYGGVVGRVSAGATELRVAIRGLRLRGRRVRVYAGAGLVRGSDPAAEARETRLKLAAIASRFGLPEPPPEPPEEDGR